MSLYVVIDTNILVSALLSSHDDAATVQVLSKVFSGDIVPLFSTETLNEYHAVLRRKKFHFPAEIVENLLNSIENIGLQVTPSQISEVLPDMKDLPFYSIVMEKQSSGAYLVTGNMKHFPQKAYIVAPNELLEILARMI